MGRKKIQISRICDERNRQVSISRQKISFGKFKFIENNYCKCKLLNKLNLHTKYFGSLNFYQQDFSWLHI